MGKRISALSVVVSMLLLAGCSESKADQPTAISTESVPPVVSVAASPPPPESTEIVGGEMTTSGPQAVDDAFLSSWKTFFPNQTEELAIAQALNICDSFKVGISADEQSRALQANVGVASGDAAYMIGTAVVAYCPEFSTQM